MLLKIVLLTLCLSSIGSGKSVVKKVADEDWWKTAVIYQIYPRSFKDSNNDGIGDLQGIIQKLDHLVDAGVTALWLSPIYKSPQKDHGYDISDFRDVDKIFGSMADFDELQQKAHDKGLKVILDYVPNHSSDEHEWFKKSNDGVPGYEDYYVWLEGRNNNTEPPNNWVSYFHGSAWKFSENRQKWYLHQFHEGQPDLNFRSPRVVQEMKDVITFWLDKGVDGFRIDTIPSLFEVATYPDEPLSGDPNSSPNDYGYLWHPYTNDQPETFDMVYQWRELMDKYNEEHSGSPRIIMTESYSDVDKLFKYYGNETNEGAHFSFNFFFITRLNAQSTARDIKHVIDTWFTHKPLKYVSNWVLGNHDQHRVASRYGVNRADGMTMLAMMLPGVAVTYNGEEIGMENGEVTWEQGQDPQACNGDPKDFDRNSRDFQRTPYQWDTTKNAGFNDGNPTWLPVSSKYLQCNLENQKGSDKNSHYKVYKAILKLRKEPTLIRGKWEIIVYSDNVFALARTLIKEKTYILVINTGNSEESIDLTKLDFVPNSLEVEIPSVHSAYKKGDNIEANSMTVGPFEAVILSGSV